MKRAFWVIALVADALGLAGAIALLAMRGATAAVTVWAAALTIVFAVLVALLLRPELVKGRKALAVAACAGLPALVLAGSLDHFMVSSQEWGGVLIAALIGGLNWAALTRPPQR